MYAHKEREGYIYERKNCSALCKERRFLLLCSIASARVDVRERERESKRIIFLRLSYTRARTCI